jgi:hypothetical protein
MPERRDASRIWHAMLENGDGARLRHGHEPQGFLATYSY